MEVLHHFIYSIGVTISYIHGHWKSPPIWFQSYKSKSFRVSECKRSKSITLETVITGVLKKLLIVVLLRHLIILETQLTKSEWDILKGELQTFTWVLKWRLFKLSHE